MPFSPGAGLGSLNHGSKAVLPGSPPDAEDFHIWPRAYTTQSLPSEVCESPLPWTECCLVILLPTHGPHSTPDPFPHTHGLYSIFGKAARLLKPTLPGQGGTWDLTSPLGTAVNQGLAEAGYDQLSCFLVGIILNWYVYLGF